MSLEVDAQAVDAPEARTDDVFAFIVGLYAAVLVAPAVITALAAASTDTGVVVFGVLGAIVAAVGGVASLARSTRLAVRLGASRWVWAAPVAPFGYAALFLLAGDAVPAVGAGAALLGMVAGMFVGMGLAVAARNRHAKAVLASAGERARFSARGPERDRRLANWTAGVLMTASLLGFVATVVVSELSPLRWLFHIGIGAGAAVTGATTERTVAVSPAGLLVGNRIQKRVRPWSAFESYALTDDALVVRRAGWSPMGLRDLRLDREEIDDSEAVAAALGEFLPRR